MVAHVEALLTGITKRVDFRPLYIRVFLPSVKGKRFAGRAQLRASHIADLPRMDASVLFTRRMGSGHQPPSPAVKYAAQRPHGGCAYSIFGSS
jgi:hypothetical protein